MTPPLEVFRKFIRFGSLTRPQVWDVCTTIVKYCGNWRVSLLIVVCCNRLFSYCKQTHFLCVCIYLFMCICLCLSVYLHLSFFVYSVFVSAGKFTWQCPRCPRWGFSSDCWSSAARTCCQLRNKRSQNAYELSKAWRTTFWNISGSPFITLFFIPLTGE